MNSFPLRGRLGVTQPLSTLAVLVGAPPPEADVEIEGVATLVGAKERDLGFLADRRYLVQVPESAAAAFLVADALDAALEEDNRPRLVVEDPHRALATLLAHFRPEEAPVAAIHPTAILGRGVTLGANVRIAPYAVVEEGAVIGEGTWIGAHAVVGAGSRIGSAVRIHPHAVVYPGTTLGDRVILHAGACIGVDGFGYVHHSGAHQKVPQVGACVIEDDVEIGANTTLDRGSIGETRVMAGAKLDNLVHLGHNVVVGRQTMMAAQSGVAGSTRIGAGVLVGGQAGLAGHLTIGDGARLAAQAGITGDVDPGTTVMGFPARPRGTFLRATAAQAKVPDILERLRRIERRLDRDPESESDREAPSK